MSTLTASNVSKDGIATLDMQYVLDGTAKAWASINGSTPAIRDSENVSSLTDISTGIFEITYTNAMGSIDYGAVVSGKGRATVRSWFHLGADAHTSPTVSKISIVSFQESDQSFFDPNFATGTVFGDLA